MDNLYARLAGQSLRRPMTPEETRLAIALEEIFASGEHDFAKVAAALQARKTSRPSGAKGAWNRRVLEEELARINASLDEAYEANDLM